MPQNEHPVALCFSGHPSFDKGAVEAISNLLNEIGFKQG